MRTTIELADEQRAKLLELAALRGEKGFSGIVAEALEEYFSKRTPDDSRNAKIRALRGSLSAEEADELRAEAAEIRASWR